MPAAKLPGFYYDEDKGKYFKIQPNHNSPAGSAGAQYSRQAIQQRGQQRAERQRKEKIAKRRSSTKKVKRPENISHITRHLLGRNHTGRPQPLAHVTPATLWCYSLNCGDSFMSWYDGDDDFQRLDAMENGDSVTLQRPRREAEFTCMSWDDFNQHLLVAGSFLGTREILKDDIIGTYSYWAWHRDVWRLMTVHSYDTLQLASYSHANMRCVAPLSSSHNMAVYTNDDKFRFFTTEQTQTDDDGELVKPVLVGVEWNVSDLYQRGLNIINQASPRPVPSHNLADVMMATRNGAILMQGSPSHFSAVYVGERREMLSADWLDANVCLLAARSGDVRLFDARVSEEVIRIRHGSAAYHVKAANRHQPLVAGIQNRMRLYDLRFSNDGSVTSAARPARSFEPHSNALVDFPEYRNANNTLAPIAVSSTIGAAAVAEGGEGVQLFDLWHGNQLDLVHNTKAGDRITALAFSNGDPGFGGMADAKLESGSEDSMTEQTRPRGPCLYIATPDRIRSCFC